MVHADSETDNPPNGQLGSVQNQFEWSDNAVIRLEQARDLQGRLAQIAARRAELEYEARLLQWAIRGYEAAVAINQLDASRSA